MSMIGVDARSEAWIPIQASTLKEWVMNLWIKAFFGCVVSVLALALQG